MKKFKVDFSETSPFKGITILFEYLEEGLKYAEENAIKAVSVWSDGNWDKQTTDFEVLKDKDFIETFHWIVPLTKKSDIKGLYYLTNLRDLRWAPDNDFAIDLSNFQKLEALNIGYNSKLIGWEKLSSLKRLFLNPVKNIDLFFLNQVKNLEYLRIIKGTFTSINGIENLNKLKTLFLQKCIHLVEIRSTLQKLPNLEQLNLEGCKNLNAKEELNGLKIKNLSII